MVQLNELHHVFIYRPMTDSVFSYIFCNFGVEKEKIRYVGNRNE